MQAVALILALVSAATESRPWAIQGVVVSEKDDTPIKGALVVLQCTCLSAARETMTNAEGRYRFGALGPGTYTVQVLKGSADVSKLVILRP